MDREDGPGYVLYHYPPGSDQSETPHYIDGVTYHATFPLTVMGKTIGLIAVDNLLTGATITHEELQDLLPFARQAASAIQKAKMIEEREEIVRRQQRLMQMSTAIASNCDLDEVVRLVRDAVADLGVVDRIGVWIANGRRFHGTWGTDEFGEPLDESHLSFPREDVVPKLEDARLRGVAYWMDPQGEILLPSGVLVKGVPRATVALRAGDEVVGFLTTDTIFSRRPITAEALELILPFAEQAAVAIQNHRMQQETIRVADQQRRLMEIAVKIAEDRNIGDVFLAVRNTILEIAPVDRVAIWIFERDVVRGTWETSLRGELVDDSKVEFPQAIVQGWIDDVAKTGASHWRENWLQPGTEDGTVQTEVPMVAIALKSGDDLVGFIGVDTPITLRPIEDETIQMIIPFAEQASVAVVKARLREDRDRLIARQRKLMEMAVMIAPRQGLDLTCQAIRDAVVFSRFVDCAGVWLVDGDAVVGTWGTDTPGERVAEHDIRLPLEHFIGPIEVTDPASIPAIIRCTAEVTTSDGELFTNVPQAIIPFTTGDRMIGLLCVDNRRTYNVLTEDELSLLQVFCENASSAISNAQLLEQQELLLKRQSRLMEISLAITANRESDEVFRLVRDAIGEMGVVDRIGMWVVDGNMARGTWGTGPDGKPRDEHSIS